MRPHEQMNRLQSQRGASPAPAVGANQAILVLGLGSRLVVATILTGLVGRACSAEDFGFFAWVGTIFFVAHLVFDLGTSTIAVREIARAPEREQAVLEGLLAWRRLWGCLFALLLALEIVRESSTERRLVLTATALALVLMAPGALAPVFTLRQSQLAPTLVRSLAQALALLVAGFFSILHIGGAFWALLHTVRELLSVAGLKTFAVRLLGFRPRAGFRGRGLRPFFAMAVIQGSAALLQIALLQTDVFFVRGLRGETELGAYAAALRPLQPLVLLPDLLFVPLFPMFAAFAERDRARFARAIRAAAGIFAGVGAIGLTLGFLLATELLHLLYGGKYLEGELSCVEAFRWLLLGLFFAFASASHRAALLADHGERFLLVTNAVALSANAVANVLLLPRFGFVAAAWTNAAAQALVWAALFAAARARSGARALPASPALLSALVIFLVLHRGASGAVWKLSLGSALGLLALLVLVLSRDARALRRELRVQPAESGIAPDSL